ncbi:putative mannose-6-phosphate isomerase GmuF [Lacunisphaera limnophila]|uniref:Putative mannose-6-phosphate isomerase GmuF n=1 Tax=Lacunisphaera limnophila TaxID=1838286 RepID=A0A1D8AVX7_9BACT|nr:type I phosphomannose isomerase catalytic subunit [Lacunisphaera limnophila]AOS45058.1 putative mannose-6-phosphate isomerase GmuF [Lacunisphaera limnophila]
MTTFLRFKPIYQERVWGGRGLESFLGRKLPGTTPIGESWELVDRPEAQSIGVEGPWAGKTLRELMATRGAELMGPDWPADRPFPILVKWLDCRERLSLQVHPPARIAPQLGGEPKTENWYVAQAEPGAAVLAGLKPGVDATAFRAALQDNTAESLVHRLPTVAGDSLLIHSGVMHAIDGGNMILEIQQNSDTTYRVYDWGRMGLDGKPRAMHVEQSMASLEANTAPAPALVRSAAQTVVLAECREFRITRHRLAAGASLSFKAGEQARILSVVGGQLTIGDSVLTLGDNGLLAYASDYRVTATADSLILVTDGFSSLEIQKP